MDRSDSIAQLAPALAKAQSAFGAVKKSGANPQLNRRYTTLGDVVDAIRKPLSENGLALVQPLTTDEAGGFVLETVLLHESGEWLSCSTTIPTWAGNRAVNELQAFGGALTYMRRYQLAALLGVNSEEDTDGNGTPPPITKVQAGPPPHWIESEQVRKRFWAWADSLTLTDKQVHEALNVEHVSEFGGTMQAAKDAILAWIDAATELAEAEREAVEVPA